MDPAPPVIPVKATVKSTYRPISKLNGDNLPKLRRLKKPELSGRIGFYNSFTRGVLNTKLNVWYRQHESTLGNLRKEQKQVYHVMCRMQREKRRVQKDEHERLRAEIRRLFNRQRKKHLIRKVVARFKENVIKKRAEREAQEQRDLADTQLDVDTNSEKMKKVVSGFRRMTEPSLHKEETISITGGNPGQHNHGLENSHVDTETVHSKSSPRISSTDMKSGKEGNIPHRSSKLSSQSKTSVMSDSFKLDAIPEMDSPDICSDKIRRYSQIEQRNTVKTELTVVKNLNANSESELHSSSTSSLPAQMDRLSLYDDNRTETQVSPINNRLVSYSDSNIRNCRHSSRTSETASKGQSPVKLRLVTKDVPVLPPISKPIISRADGGNTDIDLSFTKVHKDSKSVPRLTSNDFIGQVANANATDFQTIRDSPQTHTKSNSSLNSSVEEKLKSFQGDDLIQLQLHLEDLKDEDHNSDDSHLGRYTESHGGSEEDENEFLKRKGKKPSIAHQLKKQRQLKAKRRSLLLDSETIVKYTKRPQSEHVTAMYGQPKRFEFLPPSQKLRHEHEKMIRSERSVEVERKIRIENFFGEIFKPKDETGKPKFPVGDEDANRPKKATLSLAGVLSGLFTPKNTDNSNKNQFDRLQTCQYLRVYRPRPHTDRQREDKEERSWDSAENYLRAGFLAFAHRR